MNNDEPLDLFIKRIKKEYRLDKEETLTVYEYTGELCNPDKYKNYPSSTINMKKHRNIK